MNRREFLKLFGLTGIAMLFGFKLNEKFNRSETAWEWNSRDGFVSNQAMTSNNNVASPLTYEDLHKTFEYLDAKKPVEEYLYCEYERITGGWILHWKVDGKPLSILWFPNGGRRMIDYRWGSDDVRT